MCDLWVNADNLYNNHHVISRSYFFLYTQWVNADNLYNNHHVISRSYFFLYTQFFLSTT